MYSKEQYLKKIEKKGINIHDLFRYIISEWKKIIILSLIFFVFLGVGSYFKYKTSNNQSAQTPASMESLSSIQQVRVKNAAKLYEELNNLGDYIETSAYMQLDPYNSNICVIQYLVDSDDDSSQKKAYELYTNFIERGKLKEQLETELGVEINNISDLVSLNDFSFYTSEMNIELELNKNVFCIKINALNEEMCVKIATVVKKCLNEYKNVTVDNLVSNYDLKLVSENSYVGLDKEVKETQDKIDESLKNKQSQISDLEVKMSDAEKSVLAQKEEKVDKSEKNNNLTNSTGFSPVSLVFIFGIGVFAAITIFVLYYFINDKVKNKYEASEIFDLPYIGEIKNNSNKENIIKICKEIKALCEVNDVTEVFISCMDNLSENINLKNALSSFDDIKTTVGSNICQSIVSLEEAKKSQNVIAVIKYNQTTYKTLVEFFQKCEYLNIKVIGLMSIE